MSNPAAARAKKAVGASRVRRALRRLPTLALLAAFPGCDGCTHAAQRPASDVAARGSANATASAKRAPPHAAPPRPISPQSGCTVESGRVVFVWKGGKGAQAELSRTRAFDRVERTVKQSGAVVDPPLDAGRWFWRIQRDGETSAVWPLHVVPRSAGPVRQGLIIGDDVNGDGFADVLIEDGVVFGNPQRTAGTVPFEAAKLDVPQLHRDKGEPALHWGMPVGTGDVDGDGFQDVTVPVVRTVPRGKERIPVRLWLRGVAGKPSRLQASAVLHHHAARLGDVNDDGYADVSDCSKHFGYCKVFAGGPSGVSKTMLARLPYYDQLLGGDVNGDGHVDVVGVKGQTLAFYLSKRAQLPTHPDLEIHLKATVSARMADVDGDGLADVIGIEHVGEDQRAKASSVFLVTGGSLSGRDATATEWAWRGPSLPNPDTWSWDFLAQAGPAGLLAIAPRDDLALIGVYQVIRTRHGGFRFPPSFKPATHCQGLWNGDVRALGDFDGDGWDDLLSMPSQDVGGSLYYSVQFGSAKPFRNVCQALVLEVPSGDGLGEGEGVGFGDFQQAEP